MRLKHTPFRAVMFLLLLTQCLTLTNPFAQNQSKKDVREIKIERGQAIKVLPVHSKRFALVIGVDDYRDKQITSLDGAANDARALAAALVQYAGFPQNQIILCSSDQPDEQQPTRGRIFGYCPTYRPRCQRTACC